MSSAPFSPRIDVHTHFIPPDYRRALEENGYSHPDGMPSIPDWSPTAHLTFMTHLSITHSILSLSSPGVNLDGTSTTATHLASSTNTYASHLHLAHPQHFTFLATLPLPHLRPSLSELHRARTLPGYRGVALFSNAAGLYLDDAALTPLLAALNEGGDVVLLHPTSPTPRGDPTDPAPLYEFVFETARAVSRLLLRGVLERYPRVRWLLPHAGGAVAPVVSRVCGFSFLAAGAPTLREVEVRRLLNERCWWDCAGYVVPDADAEEEGEVGEGQLSMVLRGLGVEKGRLVYGSDYPFTKVEMVEGFARRLEGGLRALMDGEGRRGVYVRNAEGLFGGSPFEGGARGEGEGEGAQGEEDKREDVLEPVLAEVGSV